ncbi:MAG: condensation domain-containing protein [Chloroflexota bacterium]
MKNVADIYPLSPMQELMLLHAKTAVAERHDVLFNQIVYRIEGPLKKSLFKQAWQMVVDRHSTLRTIFVWQNGREPLQVVREQVTLPWIDLKWQHLSPAAQQEKLAETLAEDCAMGFDLMQAPLMRLTLIQLSEQSFQMVWSSHHLIIDRWCVGVIFAELTSIYDALVSGSYPVLPPAPPFTDYIAWIKAQEEESARAYWHAALHQSQTRPLPLNAPAESARSSSAQSSVSLIEGDEWQQLRRFASEHGLTAGTLVIGAWAIVLAAATDADEATLGLTVSGRPAELPNVDRAVGCFINNVPLRLAFNESATTVSWLEAVRDQQLTLHPFEYASPAQIQNWSQLNISGPIFDTLIILQPPIQQAAPENIEIRFDRGGMETGYPLALGVVPDREKLDLDITYDSLRVTAEMVGEITAVLRRVLLAMPNESQLTALRDHAQIDLYTSQVASEENRQANGRYAFIASRTTTEQALTQIWSEVLGIPRVSIEDQFFALGGDSIKALQIFTRIEQQFGKKLPISLLFGDPTVAQMAAAIAEDDETLPRDPVLVPLNESGTRPPIFFTHGVFGSLVWLTNILPLLEADQPAYGLQAVGLQADAEPDTTIEAMAARYIKAMQRIQPTGPYYLAGYCFGGIVAYEIARQLELLGSEIALLAIIDTIPSTVDDNLRPIYDPLRLQAIRDSAPYWLRGYKEFGGWRLKERVEAMLGRGIGPQADVNAISDRDAELHYLADFTATGSDNQQTITRINQLAGDLYIPKPYNGHITLFKAQLLGVRHALFGPVDPTSRWQILAEQGLSVRSVSGSHVGLLTNPDVIDLATQLNEVLNSAMAVKA